MMKSGPEALRDSLQALSSHDRVAYLSTLLKDIDRLELTQALASLGISTTNSSTATANTCTNLCGELMPGQSSTRCSSTAQKDHLSSLPPELILHVVSFVVEPLDLTRLLQTNRKMFKVVNESSRTWERLCRSWSYVPSTQERTRREESSSSGRTAAGTPLPDEEPLEELEKFADLPLDAALEWITARKREQIVKTQVTKRETTTGVGDVDQNYFRRKFVEEYMIQRNWRTRGRVLRSHILCNSASTVTCAALSDSWLVVALANAKLHILSATTGILSRTLVGHDTGVWTVWLINTGGKQLRDGYEYDPRDYMTPDQIIEEDKRIANLGPYLRKVVGIPEPDALGSSQTLSEDEMFNGETLGDLDWDGTDNKCSVSGGFGQRNALVLSGGCDKVLKVWDVRTGYCVHTLHGHATTIRCLGVLPHTPIAVTGSRDGIVIVWDIQMGRLVRKLRGHERSVRCIAVNWVKPGYGQPGRGMKRAVTGSYDSTCRVWDLDTGDCLHVLRGHVADIFCIAFDGARVASAGSDTTVRLWDANVGECLAILSGHTSPISTLHLSATNLCSGSLDGRVIMFDLPPLPQPPFETDETTASSSSAETSTSSSPSPSSASGSPSRRRRRSPLNPGTRNIVNNTPQTDSALSEVASSPPSLFTLHVRSLGDQFRRSFSGLAHPNFSVTSLQFGGWDSGRMLVTSGNDGLVKVWKIPSKDDSDDEGEGLAQSQSGPGPPNHSNMNAMPGLSPPSPPRTTSSSSSSSLSLQNKEYKDWNKDCFIRNLAPNPDDGTVLIVDQAGFEKRINTGLTREERMDCVHKVVWRRGICAVMGKVKGRTVVEIWSFR